MNTKNISFTTRVLIILFTTTVSRLSDLAFDFKTLATTVIIVAIGVAFWYLLEYAADRAIIRSA